jgi:hypothetical protein
VAKCPEPVSSWPPGAPITTPMRRLTIVMAIACALCTAAPAAAKRAPITGTLAKPGYTLVAVGYDGTTTSTKARRFRLRVSGKVTLHLRSPHGKYGGPVVVAMRKGRAVLGVKAGARLGKVSLKRGYAVTAKPLAQRFADRSRTTSARRGVPLGNGRNFGLVRSRAKGPSGAGGDQDRDGVPNVLDIDTDGDRVLNPLERGAAATTVAQAGPPPAGTGLNNFSQLFLDLTSTVNANASGVTDKQIDAAVRRHLSVVLLQVPPDTELDCGGLSYCSRGGSGRLEPGDPFPGAFDTDGDGLGTMPLNATGEFRLVPGATADKIGSGDTMLERTADGRELPGSLAFVFTTVPAVSTWRDGAGNAGAFNYPTSPGAPGTGGNPALLGPNAGGDYVLTLTVWRPQRQAIESAGEAAGFIDIGRLEYEVNVPNVPRAPAPQPGSGQAPQCPPASLSTSDPHLSVKTVAGGFGRVADSASDRPAKASNTLTFTVNLSECARLRGGSLQRGDALNVDIAANPANPESHDHANQIIWFRMD